MGGARSLTENWIEIQWGGAERWSRGGERGFSGFPWESSTSMITNTQTHENTNTNTKWSRGRVVLIIPSGAINFRSAELISNGKAGHRDE